MWTQRDDSNRSPSVVERFRIVKRVVYRVFVIGSLMFLGFALLRLDYLHIPHVTSWKSLTLSVLLCCAGSIAGSMTWRSAIRQVGVVAPLVVCIASEGLSIFGKYLPGKVWAIVGRASYTANMTGASFSELSGTSLSLQIVTVWTGLGIGLLELASAGGTQRLLFLTIGAWIVLTAMLLLSSSHATPLRIARRLGVPIPQLRILGISSVLHVLPWQLLTWAVWGLGFYALVRGLGADPMPWTVGLAFPLAASLGIVAVFVPGGLGIREGVLAGSLSLHGMSLSEAAGVAVAARLWFVLGEAFLFGCGAIAHFGCNVTRKEATVRNNADFWKLDDN